jgi:hypothetical protein
LKVWVVYEELESPNAEKAGRHIYGVFDSEDKAIRYRQDMVKEAPSERRDCIDLEAYEMQ